MVDTYFYSSGLQFFYVLILPTRFVRSDVDKFGFYTNSHFPFTFDWTGEKFDNSSEFSGNFIQVPVINLHVIACEWTRRQLDVQCNGLGEKCGSINHLHILWDNLWVFLAFKVTYVYVPIHLRDESNNSRIKVAKYSILRCYSLPIVKL